MNWIYVHLLLNHFPVALAVIALLMAVIALVIGPTTGVALHRNHAHALAGLSAYPASISGERAARIFRQRMPSAREAIHDHSEVADITLWILLGSGVLGIIGWYRIGSDETTAIVPGWVKVALIVPALASAAAVAITSERGGHIGHQPWETSLRSPPVLAVDSMIRVSRVRRSPSQRRLQRLRGIPRAPQRRHRVSRSRSPIASSLLTLHHFSPVARRP